MKILQRNYLVLCLLGLLFAAPGISAYLLYLHPHWLSALPTNKGELLNPPVLLHQVNTHGIWQLVLWSPQVCSQDCILQLDKLARIRLALGRHLYEVETLLLMNTGDLKVSDALKGILDEQDIHTLRLSPAQRKQMPVLKNTPGIFIINPNHYVILSYASSVKPDDIFYDLKQLITR